jgi:hypothetical protein
VQLGRFASVVCEELQAAIAVLLDRLPRRALGVERFGETQGVTRNDA